MKIAISGKGGVGKSTIAATLALLAAKKGKRVLALDADPDANFASALGIPQDKQSCIVPISKQKALIEERTGAKVKQYGQMFSLNPEVADIADSYAFKYNDVSLLVLGAVEQGGGGCACPESVLIRALVMDLIMFKDDMLIMDMEAGIEHLGRGTAKGVDTMLIVVEPGQNSIDCANRIIKMCSEINLKRIKIIANKVMDKSDEEFIRNSFSDIDILDYIYYSSEFKKADRDGESVLTNLSSENINKFESILKSLEDLSQLKSGA
jgi:CO dehydrogenase maturation factor